MSITFSTSTSKPHETKADILIIPLVQGGALPKELPETLRRRLGVLVRKVEFTGAWGSCEFLVSPEGVASRFIALVGLGDGSWSVEKQAEGLRRGLAAALVEGRKQWVRDAVVLMAHLPQATFFAEATVESIFLIDYRFDTYSKTMQKERERRGMRKVMFITSRSVLSQVRESISQAEIVMRGVALTRDLVNQPASHMSPRMLVDHAKAIAKSSSSMNITVMDREQARRAGFTAFLAVAQGSEEEPYVIHLSYVPKKAERSIALVGKGITFDSGGLSIKPADYMTDMKVDMAGAATVLGVFSLLSSLKIPIEVHGIIAACENMPSGNAYRPGDVLVAKNGKTIEVLNTDAEGRITLADALTYALEQKCNYVVDLATLTGAVMSALGETHAGFWSNDEALAKQIQGASYISGEGLVQLPLPEEYRSSIKGRVADVANLSSSRYGGAITAALFLQEFMDDTPWVHMDIAGPVHFSGPSGIPYYGYGATGYGVRTLVQLLYTLAK